MPTEPAGADPQRWLGPLRDLERHRLDNGLEICVVRSRQAPIVVSSLWYRVGSRDEAPEQRGIAHFLEHLMFKGSRRFPLGEVDRLTQSLGGENNAFTSHDVTAYYFAFAREHWTSALEIEADRMSSLLLDEAEIEREREVILEEISMVEDDPWDSLELELFDRYFGEFPYGAPILGTPKSVRSIDREALLAFYHRHYRPDNAVLAVAGDLGDSTLAEIESRFGEIKPGSGDRAALPEFSAPDSLLRVLQSKGRSPRLLLTLPAPSADHPDFAPWRLLVTVLGGGRASRLHRRLVDDGKLCSAMSVELTEAAGPGVTLVSAEPMPGADPTRVEAELLGSIVEVTRRPPSTAEVEGARRLLVADWVFGLERIHQQALSAGQAAAVFTSDYPRAHLQRLLTCDRDDLDRVAGRYLARHTQELSGVVGWSSSP